MPASRKYTKRPRRVRRRTTRYRRRTIRRKTYRKRVSNKRILNIASTKKSDVKLPYTTLPSGTGTPALAASGGVGLTGDIAYLCAYIVTAQDKTPGTTGVELPNYRAATNCYMRGYKENLRFIINNGTSWMWRRICFTYKGTYITDYDAPLNPNEAFDWETSTGWNRIWNNQNPHLTGTRLKQEMFKGSQNQDWIDIFTAPLDTDRINVKSDKVRVLRNTGGNADVRIHNYNLWYPMNANLVYDDDENGQNTASQRYSTTGQKSMGDYYIVDIFQCATSNASNTMTIYPTGRLYWHEK